MVVSLIQTGLGMIVDGIDPNINRSNYLHKVNNQGAWLGRNNCETLNRGIP